MQALDNNLNSVKLSKTTILVTVICWFTIFIEGYDLVIYGVVLPSLLNDASWGLTHTTAGAIGSYALLGMFFGSTVGGFLSDKFGRKIVLMLSLLLVTIMMMLCATTSSPEMFSIYRFIAGLGIGGIVPSASALTNEYAPKRYKSFFFVLMYTGFALGGVAAAISGILFIESFGWRFLFWLGVLPIFVLPFIWKILPESYAFLKTMGKTKQLQETVMKYKLNEHDFESIIEEDTDKVSIFSSKYIKSTVLFSLIYIGAFLLIYGINTWLPQIMKEAGYPVQSGMLFLLIFNFSAIIGGIIAGWYADKINPKRIIMITYIIAAVSIALLSIKFNMVILYVLIGIAGFGTTGTTFVLASFVMRSYESNNRAFAMGTVTAIGRIGAVIGPILVGFIMNLGGSAALNFYLFTGVAIVTAMFVFMLPSKKIRKEIVSINTSTIEDLNVKFNK